VVGGFCARCEGEDGAGGVCDGDAADEWDRWDSLCESFFPSVTTSGTWANILSTRPFFSNAQASAPPALRS
jgi:hypothetical protein